MMTSLATAADTSVMSAREVSRSRSRSRGREARSRSPEGLSAQRLTLLGRVHVARVVIESFDVSSSGVTSTHSTETTPRKGKKLRKPPRVAKTDKKYNRATFRRSRTVLFFTTCCYCFRTYFVEYNFPVSSGSRSVHAQERSALATEVIRVASKNVSGSCVKFVHRSVFPVLFDADSVASWWKSALVFKLYCRNASEKVPHLLGTCSLPLKHLLRAEALYVATEMEVKDRCRAGSRERVNLDSSQVDQMCPVVGKLKVRVNVILTVLMCMHCMVVVFL